MDLRCISFVGFHFPLLLRYPITCIINPSYLSIVKPDVFSIFYVNTERERAKDGGGHIRETREGGLGKKNGLIK